MVAQQGASVVEGRIAARNERGVKLQGEATWRNCSKFSDEPIDIPAIGTNVRLGLDKSGFIRSLVPVSNSSDQSAQYQQPAPQQYAPQQGGNEPEPRQNAEPVVIDRDRRIMRQATINSAIALLTTHGVALEVADVLETAEMLEMWVLR